MRLHLTLLTLLLSFSTLLTAQIAADFTLTSTDGEDFSLYEGHLDVGKTVIVEAFHVNCPPCRRLAPHMSTLHKSMVENNINVEFISISTLKSNTDEHIAEFKQEFDHDWPFFRNTEESQAVLNSLGNIFATPTILVIAPDKTFSNIKGIGLQPEEWVQLIGDEALATQEAYNASNQEPMDPPPAMAIVTGGITTTKGDGLEGVTINFVGAKDTAIVSSELGNFQTGSLLADETYTVSLEKNDDIANGVTTLDIVLASKHILGIEAFDQSFQSIAADVNKSGSVTTFDLVLMRQVILGSRSDFPGNTSWVFEPSEVEISSLQELGELSFSAIKIGDLNESAKPNSSSLLSSTDRSFDGALNISTTDQEFRTGEQINVTLSGADFMDIQGFQFTLNFDPNVLKLNDLSVGDLTDFSLANTNLKLKDRGVLSTSWNGRISNVDPTLFKLSFTALEDGTLSELLTINSDLTKAEGYNLAEEVLAVELAFEAKTVATKDGILLYPNPTKSDKLYLTFENPKTQKITIRLTNINGQSIQNVDFDLTEGHQALDINTADLEAGVYLVQILSGQNIIESARLIKQ